jgi:inosose dehydratase
LAWNITGKLRLSMPPHFALSTAMLVSCAIDAFTPCPVADALWAIADSGLKHVEVPWRLLCQEGNPVGMPCDGQVANILALLEGHGLQAASLSLIGGPTLAAVASSEDSEALSAACWRAARELGAKLVVAELGVVASDVEHGDSKRGESQSSCLLARLAHWADEAAAAGLTLAVENRPGLCVDSRGMQKLIEQVAHPAVRLHYDTGGYACRNPWSSWEVALQRVCGWLGGVRLTDHAGTAGDERFPPLGEGGAIDFARTLEILRPMRFARPCTIDFRIKGRRRDRPGAPNAGGVSLEKCRAGLERSVTQLRRSGWFC